MPVASYVALGVAGSGAVVGTIFGLKALAQKRDFDNGDRTTSKVEAIEKTSLYADMAFGAALTFGVVGASLWWAQRKERTGPTVDTGDAEAVVLAPMVSPSGSGATALFRF